MANNIKRNHSIIAEIKANFRKHTLNRQVRISKRIDYKIEFINSNCNEEVKKEIAQQVEEFEELTKKINLINIFRSICYILLYISFFSAIFAHIIVVGEAIQLLARISGAMSSLIWLSIIFFLNKIGEAFITDLIIIAGDINSAYIKYKDEKACKITV